ncbi:hypothetical protein COCMIDRAFT_40035 [Bipolaris oryzae ATCC 44560]|uniref:Uncharacterized protein n=1 Tax=Bipolaris oryzae ATCC 44560 TaxID=930090 RepID=W6ZE75_COCMI|nr:uncharacterized protein COCMIDRAFT_40035 [Bipolaris oryzae ATCC 44560]EUC41826.1 hypothetical protein COCMIDRAFT_40035 [Bipolaris oryzae ATCC 44560]
MRRANCKDRVFPSKLLASVALEASELLLRNSIQNKNAPVSSIAVRLGYIGRDLLSQPLYELPANVQQFLERSLHFLLDICLDQVKTQQSIIKFCKARPSTIKPFQDHFINLANKLSKNDDDFDGSNIDSNPFGHIEPPAKDVYPGEVHQLLLDRIEKYSSCGKKIHKDAGSNPSKLHITRLCLSSGFRFSKDQLALFDIITALSQMSSWQEMTINIPKGDHGPKHNHDYQQHAAWDSQSLSLIDSGKICEWLEDPTYTKYCLKHKIKLSYTVANAFWQLCSSDLMKARWTSNDIWFIHVDKSVEESDAIPVRAFVLFPFGSQFHEAPSEFYGENRYRHCYPRILYLGIILLEIGLEQSLSIERKPAHSFAAHINLARSKAIIKLKELKNADWGGFQRKDYYIKAIENCGKNDNTTRWDSPLEERRKALFRNVVKPLFWLATVGFENSEEVSLVPIRKEPRRQSTFTGNDELEKFWREKRTLSSFCSGNNNNNTEEYLGDLQKIAGHTHRCRRLAKITKPIRVAILDTGCKIDLDDSSFETDSFDHGTFMARLLMHVAPVADLYLISVAENTHMLQNSQHSITKAIEHAGLDPEWNVGIISMSFGYYGKQEMSHTIIGEAIEKVKKHRNDKILFLASAGNSWSQRTSFPASHKDVISIYAGDSKGVFLNTNLAYIGKKLGIYGKDVPSSVINEVKSHFIEVDLSSGTSIATAIATSIVAMMLSYAAALPSIMKNNGFGEILVKLSTKKGMEHMLEAMSLNRHDKEYFISPIRYWGEKEKDLDVLVSICGAIEQMNRQPPE